MADSKPAAYSAPAAQALPSQVADRVRPNARLIALLSLGHFVVDLNRGSLPAYLPVLKTAHQLSYASAATIVLAALGWIADRYGLPAALWISAVMPLAAFVAARFLPAPRAIETR